MQQLDGSIATAKITSTVRGSFTTLRGPYDESPLDDRGDILRFVTAPFTEVMENTGPVRAVLFAASSAPDSELMAKLIVVKPDGMACNLVDG
jgi:predicted acyl esterase